MAARTNRRWAARWCHSCCAPAHLTDWWCSGRGKESAPPLLLIMPGQAIRWETREKGKEAGAEIPALLWTGNSSLFRRLAGLLGKTGPPHVESCSLRRWSLSKQRVRMPGFFPKTKPAFCPRNRCKGNCSFLAATTRILTSVTEVFCSRINPLHKQIWKMVANRGLLLYRGEIIGIWTGKKKSREWR